MEKYSLISAALSVSVVVLLSLHQSLIQLFGNQDWLNMVIGLPVGVAMACNIDLVVRKIRPRK
jgi:hypothetical protein